MDCKVVVWFFKNTSCNYWYSAKFRALLDSFSAKSRSTAHLLILRALFGSEVTVVSREGKENGNQEF